MAEDLAFGDFSGFLLRNGFVQARVKKLAGGVHFFEPRFLEHLLEQLVNHADARLQRVRGASFRGLSSRQRHVKIIQDGDQFLQQLLVGILDGIQFFAGSPLFEIVEVCGGAEQPVPMLVRLGRALPEFVQLVRSQRRGTNLHQGLRCARPLGRFGLSFSFGINFFHGTQLPYPRSIAGK